jgi:hypothetical protein
MDGEAKRQLDRMERDGIQAVDGDARTMQYNQYITGAHWLSADVG